MRSNVDLVAHSADNSICNGDYDELCIRAEHPTGLCKWTFEAIQTILEAATM